MLFKLLKYDFRSMWKQFSIIWPAALIIGLINRFTLPFSSDSGANWVVSQEWMSIISITLFFGVMFSMFVASVVYSSVAVLFRAIKGKPRAVAGFLIPQALNLRTVRAFAILQVYNSLLTEENKKLPFSEHCISL